MPDPAAQQQLDTVLGAVTQVFVLSLAVERICALLKHMSVGFWGSEGRKNLKKGKGNVEIDDRRGVHSINSLIVGVVVAGLTRSNAFGALTHSTAQGVAEVAQIAMTGAAAGVGSSFWYDLLSLLMTVRQARQDAGAAQRASAEQIVGAAGAGASGFVGRLREGDRPAETG
jgi:hypothetical protein